MSCHVIHLHCSFAVIAFISLPDHIPQYCVLMVSCSCYHRSTALHLAPRVCALPSVFTSAYLPFSMGKFSSRFYFLLAFSCSLSFLFLCILLSLSHLFSRLISPLSYSFTSHFAIFFTFLFFLSFCEIASTSL